MTIQPHPIPRLELRFDRRLVDDRPHLHDLRSSELVEHILGKGNFLAVEVEPKEFSLRRAVKGEPARDIRRVGS
jgi:hypothetical protein